MKKRRGGQALKRSGRAEFDFGKKGKIERKAFERVRNSLISSIAGGESHYSGNPSPLGDSTFSCDKDGLASATHKKTAFSRKKVRPNPAVGD